MATATAPRRKAGSLRPDRLTGGQKAAILVMSLGPEVTDSLMGELTPDELPSKLQHDSHLSTLGDGNLLTLCPAAFMPSF